MIRSAILLPMLLAASPCRAQEPQSFALTTDTPAYCTQLGTQLAHQIADRHSQSAEVRHLMEDGREMCERGQIRGGIRRLRQALLLLHHRMLRDGP